jgi:amidase
MAPSGAPSLDVPAEPIGGKLSDEGEPEGLFGEYKRLSAYELWKLQWRKRQLQKDYLDLWVSTKGKTTGRKMDAVIMPMAPYPAPPHGKNMYVLIA